MDWDAFWDRLHDRASAPEAVALLEDLRDGPVDPRTAAAMIASLDARREPPPPRRAVNIVGSGGGPATFNLSTAAAITAAASGVRVIKSGSRGYTSRYGSVDLLKLLGIPLASSQEEIDAALERGGIAFAGAFVYPAELRLLAKRVFPRNWRTLGAFVNRMGPFLAAVGADAQLTGVSDPALLRLYTALGVRRRLWLVSNAAGVDEFVSFADNAIAGVGTVPRRSGGSLQDLRGGEDVAAQFHALLRGEGPAAALDSIALNAAGMIVLNGAAGWDDAFDEARAALRTGAALAKLDGLRACPASSSS
jgi:anthranilate phosphoribosyltransferase